jgi:hypothetical protein
VVVVVEFFCWSFVAVLIFSFLVSDKKLGVPGHYVLQASQPLLRRRPISCRTATDLGIGQEMGEAGNLEF